MARKPYEDDDGRTVANMNVEGMPWYVPERPELSPGDKPEPLTRRELWRFIRSATAAALLVAGVLSLALVLFVLFCTKVWLR